MKHCQLLLICATLFSCGEVIIDTDSSVQSDSAPVCTQDTDCQNAASCQSAMCVDGACVYENAPGLDCDDGNICTDGETCQEDGTCAGGVEIATDGVGCQTCTCTQEDGLVCTPSEVGAQCDDGDCCTTSDLCSACDPEEDFCPDFGLICGGTATDCDDNDPCTLDSCACDEGGPSCTTSPSEDGTACVYDPAACTEGDQCVEGTCTAGPEINLDDDNSCTLDACEDGVVTHSATPGASCDDDNACTTTDECVEDVCVGTDALVCTVPECASAVACEPASGCVPLWEPVGTDCDDQDICTLADACGENNVCSGVPRCDDNNPCTLDSCAEDGTCTNAPDTGTDCDDQELCTQNDQCSAEGDCVGEAVDCSDVNDPCLKRECNPDSGLCNMPQDYGTPCESDNYGCTWDVCQDGTCANLPRPTHASFPGVTGFAEKIVTMPDGSFAVLVRRIDQKLILLHADGLGQTISTSEIAESVIGIAGIELTSDGGVMVAYTTGADFQLCHIVKLDLAGQEDWAQTLIGSCAATGRAATNSAYPQFLVAGFLDSVDAWFAAVLETGTTLFYKTVEPNLSNGEEIYDARFLSIVENGNLGYFAAGFVVINDGTSGGWVSFPKKAWAVNVTGNLVVDHQISWTDPLIDLSVAFTSAAKKPNSDNSYTLGASFYPDNGTWYNPNMSYLIELTFPESGSNEPPTLTTLNSIEGGAVIAMKATQNDVVSVGKLETDQSDGWIRVMHPDKSYAQPVESEANVWFRDLSIFGQDGIGEMVVLGRDNTIPTVRFLNANGGYCGGADPEIFEQCAGVGILDCQGSCAPEELMNNGVCDSIGATFLGNEIDLDCSALSFEGGDCAPLTE